jgi:F420-dependent methylenetetrahydromethanopterin dehydrogenase
MSKPRGFFKHEETNSDHQAAEKKTVTDVVMSTDKIITREEYERQLAEAKAMAFGI